jgi:DNA-binding PadR family transcriptional regulator
MYRGCQNLQALYRCLAPNGGFAEMEAKLSPDLLRGHTDTVVLNILRHGDAYGFEIYNTILERTEGKYELKETTLYSSYKRLEADGLVTSYWGDETLGGRRKYYHLTEKGRQVWKQNTLNWRYTRRILNRLLKVGKPQQDTVTKAVTVTTGD